jgi:hypothetical protein
MDGFDMKQALILAEKNSKNGLDVNQLHEMKNLACTDIDRSLY